MTIGKYKKKDSVTKNRRKKKIIGWNCKTFEEYEHLQAWNQLQTLNALGALNLAFWE